MVLMTRFLDALEVDEVGIVLGELGPDRLAEAIRRKGGFGGLERLSAQGPACDLILAATS